MSLSDVPPTGAGAVPAARAVPGSGVVPGTEVVPGTGVVSGSGVVPGAEVVSGAEVVLGAGGGVVPGAGVEGPDPAGLNRYRTSESGPSMHETDAASPVIGLVAITYSPGTALVGMLDSLDDAYRGELRVILADNGSTDGSVDQAAGRPGVRLVRTGGNLGYGGAANVGVRELDPGIDWVVITNPDIVFAPHTIDLLLECALRHPASGAFGPLITTPQGVVYPSARNLPSISAGVGHALFGWWWPTNPWTRRYRLDAREPVERVAGWLSGSCLLVRRKAFEQVGGFDPGYFMYFEDVDLGDRLARAGWSNVYCPSARVSHEGGHATEREPNAMARAHHRSAYRYLATRHPARWQAPLRWVLRAGLAGRAWLARRLNKVAAGAELPPRHADHLPRRGPRG